MFALERIIFMMISVVGASEEEHDERLNEIVKKLEESGLTLNYNKWQIGVSSMEYLGNVLTGKGLQVSDDKLKPLCRHQDQRTNQSCEASFCAILCKVRPKLCDHCQPTMGSDQNSC